MSGEDALTLLQRVIQLEDALAQCRHANESMRQRLAEIENLFNAVSVGPTGNQWWTIPDPPETLLARGGPS